MKRLKEAEEGLLEAEAVALEAQKRAEEECLVPKAESRAQEEESRAEEESSSGTRPRRGGDEPPADGSDRRRAPAAARPGAVPATPQVVASHVGCAAGAAFFPSLRTLFASAPDPCFGDPNAPYAHPVAPHAQAVADMTREEARERIAALVAGGWEVSADVCPRCDLALFAKDDRGVVSERCVVCGPTSIAKTVTEADTALEKPEEAPDAMAKDVQGAVTREMMRRIMDGWNIDEGAPCSRCGIPTMLEPETQHKHCVACEVSHGSRALVVSTPPLAAEGGETDGSSGMPATQIADANQEAGADVTKRMIDRIMEGWSVVQGSQCPACAQPLMFEPGTHLTHCIACGVIVSVQCEVADPASENFDPNKHESPPFSPKPFIERSALKVRDPTPSMFEFKSRRQGEVVDPEGDVVLQIERPMERAPFQMRDPTPSTSELKRRYRGGAVDPEGRWQNELPEDHISATNAVTRFVTHGTYPTMHGMRKELYRPGTQLYGPGMTAPNVLAMRNELCVSPPERAHGRARGPSPNVQANGVERAILTPQVVTDMEGEFAARCIAGSPPPATCMLRYGSNTPTPNMPSVWQKHAAASYQATSTHSQTRASLIQGADPTPSNCVLYHKKVVIEEGGHGSDKGWFGLFDGCTDV